MTKKDYETIAACIGAAAAHADSAQAKRTLYDIQTRLITEFELDNPRFDKAKFWSRIEHWRTNHGGD